MPVDRSLLHLFTALALGVSVTAQSARWSIPPAGCATYGRATRVLVCPPEQIGRSGSRVVPLGSHGGAPFRFRVGAAAGGEGFEVPAFDDSTWATGRSPFGDRAHDSPWPASERFLEARTRFELGRRPRAAVLTVVHDDGCTIWLNGVEVYRNAAWTPDPHHVELGREAVEALSRGDNILAARVENTGGPGRFDVALAVFDRSFSEPGAAARLCREDDAAAGRLLDSLFAAFRPPGTLCAGQLDESLQFVSAPPIDLRELGAWLAFDLRRIDGGHTVSVTAPRVWRFGDVDLRGRADPPASDGTQRVRVDIRSGEPAARGDDRRFLDRWVLPHHRHELDGSMTVARRVDPDAGVVRAVESRLAASIRPGDGAGDRTFTLLIDDVWTFERLRENRDVEFREDVAKAIRNGAGWLQGQLGDLGAPDVRGGSHDDRTYGTGRLALALLALVHAELPRDHPTLVAGFGELRRRELRDTYSIAHAIMALEALWAPRGELEDLRAGAIDRPRPRQPSAEDRELLGRWAQLLLENVDTRVDAAYALRFNYVPAPRYDHSVQQYALLGLYSAHLCGVPVSTTVWNAAASHLIGDQSEPRGTRDLTLTTYRQLEEIRAGRTTTAAPRPTGIAGWGYQEPDQNGVELPIYGAMTCAGISGLTICRAGLRDAGVTRASLERAADQAIRQGFAWLAEHFTVHWHAGRVHEPYAWVYYYLYGLERACELSGIARIDDRDWYHEGALTLLALQAGDGSWPSESGRGARLEQTAMAILFLKQASLPVYTGR